MNRIIAIALCFVCVLAVSCYGSSEYDELNKEVCAFLDVPLYPVPTGFTTHCIVNKKAN
jgi:hypothetical protein